jgi:hypothetical protein
MTDSNTTNINEIDNYSPELWQRQHIGLHTYIPSIVLNIWAFYKSFVAPE